MKRALRQLIPPILLTTAKNFKQAGERLYPSWEAACEASETLYDARLVNEFRVARAMHNRHVGWRLTDRSVLTLVSAICGSGTSITDFGGATGEYYDAIQPLIPSVSYTVVENPTLVSLMAAAGAPVHFSAEIPSECDVFFSSGTLQCIKDPYLLFARACTSARRAIVLIRNSFCDEDIFRVQISRLFDNGGGAVPPGFRDQHIRYPHRTIREKLIHAIAEEHGFALACRLDDVDGVLPYRNKVYGAQLAFVKRSAI